jgi:O-antigen ligase
MRRLYVPIILFIGLGYIITTSVLVRTGIPVSAYNQSIRAAEAGLLLVTILLTIPGLRTGNSAILPLLAFFFVYAIRLLDDVISKELLMVYQTPTYVLGYFFGLTVLPLLSIGLLYRHRDIDAIFRTSLVFLIAANLALFLYAVTGEGGPAGGAFAGRVEERGELEGTATLGPIWFGVAGAMLATMLVGIFSTRAGFSPKQWVASMALLCVSGANILFAASRGPALAFGLAILLFLLNIANKSGSAKASISRWRALLMTILIVTSFAAIIALSNGTVFLFERFILMYDQRVEGGIEERDLIFSSAWMDFLSSPLFGRSYVTSYENSSPHNIVLESLMATGLFGSALFFWALIRAFVGIWRLIDGMRGPSGVSLALATVVLLVVGLTSSSINQSPHLWIFVALVTVMSAPDAPGRRHPPLRETLRWRRQK